MKFLERRPLCNNNPSSAPHIKGRCFILCWRCVGGVFGVLFWYLLQRIIMTDINAGTLLGLWILIIPACVDYVMIKTGKIYAHNIRRFWTGCLLGVPIAETILKLMTMIG